MMKLSISGIVRSVFLVTVLSSSSAFAELPQEKNAFCATSSYSVRNAPDLQERLFFLSGRETIHLAQGQACTDACMVGCRHLYGACATSGASAYECEVAYNDCMFRCGCY